MKTKFDGVRSSLMDAIQNELTAKDYEVLRTGSQELCIPIVGDEQEEGYLVITFKVPKGERNGDPYDGYEAAQAYADKVKANAEKKEAAAKKKAEKIARDKAAREAKAAAKAKREEAGQ
jgi:hypothetical protein